MISCPCYHVFYYALFACYLCILYLVCCIRVIAIAPRPRPNHNPEFQKRERKVSRQRLTQTQPPSPQASHAASCERAMVKKPTTPISPSFPWEQLKAESMRSICRDLGLKAASNRSMMTHFLESVSKIGCESPLFFFFFLGEGTFWHPPQPSFSPLDSIGGELFFFPLLYENNNFYQRTNSA